MPKEYQLEVKNWGFEDYVVGTKGHHHYADFKKAVHADECFRDWPLGEPVHDWFKAVPNHDDGVFFHANAKGLRGAFPVTVAYESYERIKRKF